MITVSISINGHVIVARSAFNKGTVDSDGATLYNVDDGGHIWHKPEAGAIPLAIKMLKRIKEIKS